MTRLTKKCATTLLALALSTPLAGQQSRLDGNPALFTVLAAINAAGYDAELQSAANHPLREELRKDLAARGLPIIAELKRFFAAHRKKDSGAELSQYVSFALCVEGPPNFQYRLQPHELPPDVAALEGFERLLARFHKEANIEEWWRKAQPALDQILARHQEPVTRALLEVDGYLRNPGIGYLGRRFQVIIDVLGAPNQIHTRSYADDYFVVLTPSPEPQIADIRHAYFHFLLDPLATKYGAELAKKKALADYAQPAPYLESYYKSDFLLLATESLIKAAESRLAAASARAGLVNQALREGFVLTPHFAEQLPAYEKQERAMRLYFPEMITALDLKKEERRLERVEFSNERPVRLAQVVPAERPVELTGARKTFEEAEQLYTGRQLDRARETYLRVLRETDEKLLHARSYYGLARIAALQRDPELAEKLFEKTLELGPDPQMKAWTYVYLARLAENSSAPEGAARHYQAALAVEGASAAARQAAQKGLQEPKK